MQTIYSLAFDLFPGSPPKHTIQMPYDYIFRGIVMRWIAEVNRSLGNELHKTDQKGGKKTIRKYSIYHKFNAAITNNANTKPNSAGGVRFILNIFSGEMIDALIDYVMKKNTSTVQLGPQKCIISKIEVKQIDPHEIVRSAQPLNRIELMFRSPTAFKQMGTNKYLFTPVAEKIYGNLAKQWNNLYEDTSFPCPDDFYDWVVGNVHVQKTDLSIRSWKMGKGKHRFKGFKGWVLMDISDDDGKMSEWVHILSKFGELSNTGSGRTAGFGHFDIVNLIPIKTH
ncbi:MAG: CRISPR system precrRNA processing endoribonuclease RAMP protein Cas6 [Candidatus Lokiarchaeota archaeon]|nr:CRISPR system precrRNA processing endoribonuclease RAMP protein Cas6 [Candidatus Lokiarchaeota archaeon]